MSITVIVQRTLNAVQSACNAVVKHVAEADWEQRRYEIAKDFATRMYAASCYTGTKSDAIKAGVKFADELIAELQKPRT